MKRLLPDGLIFVLGGTICSFLLTWLAASGDYGATGFSFSGQKIDHYNLLVDGFIDGQTAMKAEVHPDRLSGDLETRLRAPYLIDASLYQGRYYLYYGVVPAVLLLLPYSTLTGNDLSLNAATLFFVLVGLWVSISWFRRIRRLYFSGGTGCLDGAAVCLLAFGPATTFLVRRGHFYELPLAAGYAFLCIFIWAATRALTAPAYGRRWIVAASLSIGLAAGCHPNYALLAPLVAVIAWRCFQRAPDRNAKRQPWTMACAAVIPAGLVGLALALYNYFRFGDPFEFGFNYGLNPLMDTGATLISPAFIWTNFKWYYLTPPSFLPYFPFIFPINATFLPSGYLGNEAIHGQFFTFLWLVWTCLGGVVWSRPREWPPLLRYLVWILAGATAISALVILAFGIRANRYLVDFQYPLVAGALLLAVLIHQNAGRSTVARLWRAGWIGGVGILSAHNILGAVQQFDDFRNTRPGEFAELSRRLNPSWAFWERFDLVSTGTVRFDIAFEGQSTPIGEPLLTLGVPGYTDAVYALQYTGGRVEFLIDHFGQGGPRSRMISYTPGKTYQMEITLGSFSPPAFDPSHAHRPAHELERIKSRARVVFDGQVVIDQSLPFYDAAPWQREFGSNHLSATRFARQFSGQISNVAWVPDESPPGLDRSPVIRLTALFADNQPRTAQPVLGFGVAGAGTLLAMKPEGANQWSFVVDEWGLAAHTSEPIAIPAGENVIDVMIGPRLARDQWPADRPELADQLIVWVNGREAARISLMQSGERFLHVAVGSNPQGFSTSDANFYSRIDRQLITESEQATILSRVAAP